MDFSIRLNLVLCNMGDNDSKCEGRAIVLMFETTIRCEQNVESSLASAHDFGIR